MKYNFEKFEKTHARLENRISITASSSFGFPTKFYKDNRLARYNYVVIYFDRQNMAIGFNFSNDEVEKHKFTLIKSTQGYGASAVATSFFKTYNIDPKKYKGKYEWKRLNLKGVGRVYVIEPKKKEKNKDE